MKRWVFSILLGFFPVILSSCGGATTAAAALLRAGGSSGGKSSPTLVSDVRPIPGQSGLKLSPLSFAFRLTDRESNPADVEVLYTYPGAARLEQALLNGVTNLDNLATSPQGVEHSRQWDFAAQLPQAGSFLEDVRLVVRLRTGSSSSMSSLFDVGNDPPQVSILSTPSGELSGVVAINLQVLDSSSDAVTVQAEYENLDDGAGWRPATPLGPSLSDFVAPPGGLAVRFIWDVISDEPGKEIRARLRFTPEDDVETGTPADTAVLTIDNNSEPLVFLDGSAFFANPDERRGIPVPFTVLDDEGDAVDVVFQWRRPGESFPSLPTDRGELAQILADPASRRQAQIASEKPTAFEGYVVPAGASTARLHELASIASGLLREFIVGREIEILRLAGEPASLVSTWASSPLALPAAGLPIEGGDSALFLESTAAKTWRLREIDLATGTVVRTVASGADGDPNLMTYGASETSVLVAVDDASTWKLSRVDLATGAVTSLITASGSTQLGQVRGLVASSEQTAMITVQSSLIAVDFSDLASPRETTLFDDLQGAWGLALDPRRQDRLYLAERDWVNPDTSAVEGRLVTVDLRSLVRTRIVPGDVSLPRPTAIALERDSTRLLALTDANTIDGTVELRAVELSGEAAGMAFEVGSGYPQDSRGLSTGRDQLRLFCIPSLNDVVAAGGMEQVRTIASYDPASCQADVSSPFDPPLNPRQKWRIVDRSSVLPAGSTLRRDVFVWDSSDAVATGEVMLRAFAVDTEIGLATDMRVPRTVRQGIDVVATNIGGSGFTDGVSSLVAADLDGDGKLDLVSANAEADSLTVFFQIGAGAFSTAPDLTLQGIVLLAEMDEPVAVAAVDADLDGDLDLVSANRSSDNLTLALQSAPGVFAVQPLAIASGLLAPVDIAVADFDEDGAPDLASAYLGSDKVAIYLQAAGGLYFPTPSFVLGDASTLGPSGLAVGDLDGDGDVDLVSADANSDNIAVYLQDAPGSFPTSPSTVLGNAPAPDGPQAVVVADLDGDGAPDIASANRAGNNVAVFLQSGGIFPASPTFLLSGPGGLVQARHLAVGDINGDGANDLVVVGTSDKLDVFLYRKDIDRLAPVPLVLLGDGALAGPAHVLLEDLDGDGLLDLAAANNQGDDIAVFLQNSEASFSISPPDLVLGNSVDTPGGSGVAAGDLDDDGDLDLVLANSGNGTLTIYPQLGPRVVATTPALTLGGDTDTAGAVAVDASDLDGDGLLDIVSANRSAGTITVFFHQSDGVFASFPSLALSLGEPVSLRSADLDGDGDLDIACADRTGNSLQVFLQGAGGAFGPAPDLIIGDASTTNAPTTVHAADLDGDGKADLLCASGGGSSIAVFFQGAAGSFPGTPSLILGGPGQTDSPQALAAADLDRDGDMDILSANAAGDDLTVFFASAPGAFPFAPSGHLTDSAMAQPSSLQAVDVNGDGSCDIVSGNPGTDNLTIFFQRRPGEFLLPRAIGGTGFTDSPVGLVVVDFDGDGEPDLISAQPELDNTAVFYGGR